MRRRDVLDSTRKLLGTMARNPGVAARRYVDGLEPLLDPGRPDRTLHLVGLELSPFYRDPRTGRAHPRVVQALRRLEMVER